MQTPTGLLETDATTKQPKPITHVDLTCFLCVGMKKVKGVLTLVQPYGIQFEPDGDDAYYLEAEEISPGEGLRKYTVNIKPSMIRHSALAHHLPHACVKDARAELEHMQHTVSAQFAKAAMKKKAPEPTHARLLQRQVTEALTRSAGTLHTLEMNEVNRNRHHQRPTPQRRSFDAPVHSEFATPRHSLDFVRPPPEDLLDAGAAHPVHRRAVLPRHYLLLSYLTPFRAKKAGPAHAYFLADAAQLSAFYSALLVSIVRAKRVLAGTRRRRLSAHASVESDLEDTVRPYLAHASVVPPLPGRFSEAHLEDMMDLAESSSAARSPLDELRDRWQMKPGDGSGQSAEEKIAWEYPSDVSVDSFPPSPEGGFLRQRSTAKLPQRTKGKRKTKTLPVFEPVSVTDKDCETLHTVAGIAEAIPSLRRAGRTTRKTGIITLEALAEVRHYLPSYLQHREPRLVYSDYKHGRSFTTMMRAANEEENTLLCIETRDGAVLGGFAPHPWAMHPGYFGSGEAFVFKLNPHRQCHVFPWKGANNSFQLCNQRGLAFGGGGAGTGVAIYLKADLRHGESNMCPTFGNPALVRLGEEESFEVAGVELWSLHT